jgi:hypothetical protein
VRCNLLAQLRGLAAVLDARSAARAANRTEAAARARQLGLIP